MWQGHCSRPGGCQASQCCGPEHAEAPAQAGRRSLLPPVLFAALLACLGYFGQLGALYYPLYSWWSAVNPQEGFLRVRSLWPLLIILPVVSPMTLVLLPMVLLVRSLPLPSAPRASLPLTGCVRV